MLSVAGAVVLTLGACKGSDKGSGAVNSKSVAALNLPKGEANVFGKYFQTEDCSVDEQEALGALAGLGMGEAGEQGVNYDAREFKDGVVTYKGLKLADGDVDFSAGSVVVYCPQMGDEAPSFDRIDITDIMMLSNFDDTQITAKTINVAKPSAGVARDIIANLTSPGSDMNDFRLGALSVTGIDMKTDEVNGSIGSMSWGQSRDSEGQGTADLSMEDIDFTVNDGGQNMSFKFEGMSARNVNLGVQTESSEGLSPEEAFDSLMASMTTVTGKPYDEFIIGKLNMDSDIASLDFGGMEAKTKEKGKVITTTQKIKQSVINFKPAMGQDPSMAQAYGMLQSLDMDKIGFSGSSVTKIDRGKDSIAVSDGLFVLDDLMKWNFEYEADGVAAMMDSLKAAQLGGASETELLQAYSALQLKGFRMTIEDDSIVEKGMTLATQMTGQSEAQIKLMLTGASFMASSAAQNELQADVYSKAATAFAEFAKDGGKLTIEMDPPKPFALAPFFNGQADDISPSALGFSAKRTK